MQICLEEACQKAVEIQKTYMKEDQLVMERLQKWQERFRQASSTRTVVPLSCDKGAKTFLSRSQRHQNRTDMTATMPTLDEMNDYKQSMAMRAPVPVLCETSMVAGKSVIDQDKILHAHI